MHRSKSWGKMRTPWSSKGWQEHRKSSHYKIKPINTPIHYWSLRTAVACYRSLWILPHRLYSANVSRHGVYIHCRCKQSGPGPGCAIPPACTWCSTCSAAESWTPSAYPVLMSRRRPFRPLGRRSAGDRGQWWVVVSWLWAQSADGLQKTPGRTSRNR